MENYEYNSFFDHNAIATNVKIGASNLDNLILTSCKNPVGAEIEAVGHGQLSYVTSIPETNNVFQCVDEK